MKKELDAGGKITGYIVKLLEAEEVTVTLYDTKVKMRIQGGNQQDLYTKRALIPYLNDQISIAKDEVNELNEYFLSLPKHPKNDDINSVKEPSEDTIMKSKTPDRKIR